VNPESTSPPGARSPRGVRWAAWTLLILMGGTVVVPVIAAFVTAVMDGLDLGKLPFLVAIVLWVVLFLALKSLFHPIRGRTDESRAWRERFPTRSDQEVQRFLRIVGESLALREDRQCRLRPDDRVRDLTQEVFCGDGMDIVELVLAVEEEYGLELPESGSETLGEVFDYVIRHGSSRPVSPAAGRWQAPAGDWYRGPSKPYEG
jgi:acyl carrier protein